MPRKSSIAIILCGLPREGMLKQQQQQQPINISKVKAMRKKY